MQQYFQPYCLHFWGQLFAAGFMDAWYFKKFKIIGDYFCLFSDKGNFAFLTSEKRENGASEIASVRRA